MSMRGNIKGKQLKAWRAGNGWYVREAAEKLGIPFDTYRQYEADKRPIPDVVRVAMRGVDLERRDT